MPDYLSRFTPEQIRMMQEYAASNDFTGKSLNVNKTKFTEEQGQLYQKACSLFADEWKARLPDFGVKDSIVTSA